MHKKKVFVVSQYLINDPPTHNAIQYLSKYFDVTYFEQSSNEFSSIITNIHFKKIYRFGFIRIRFIRRLIAYKWLGFILNRAIRKEKPLAVIAIMYEPISVLKKIENIKYIGSILDVPSALSIGKFDQFILKNALDKLAFFDIVWGSDVLKANWISENSKLKRLAKVCHNCPSINYFVGFEKREAREWLVNRLQLEEIAVTIKSTILLRAGAVGNYGGIEETILALKSLPEQVIFVLMGRPEKEYKNHLLSYIKMHCMQQRVFLFDRPDDVTWKRILLGSDIGHLIHVRPDENIKASDFFDLNSSLSNNRLFQYMAAGLPILSYKDFRMKKIYYEVDCFEQVDVGKLKLSLIEQLLILVNNEELRLMKGENGRLHFMLKYNWESQFKLIHDFIN